MDAAVSVVSFDVPAYAGTEVRLWLVQDEEDVDENESESENNGYRPMPTSQDISPLSPEGYKPDVYFRYDGEIAAAYGQFSTTAGTGGRVTVDVNGLAYDEGWGKVPEGRYAVLYSSADGSISGLVTGIKLSATTDPGPSGEKSGGSGGSGGGCELGAEVLGGLALLALLAGKLKSWSKN